MPICARDRRPLIAACERINSGETSMNEDIAKHPPDQLFQLVTDRWTSPFWDATQQHRLTAACCSDCKTFRMPPTPFCPNCLSQKIDWPTLSGVGEIYSYTIVSKAIFPEMESSLPYVPCLITLPDADNIRLISNIVDVPVNRIAIGLSVKVVWANMPDGSVVPRFTLRNL